MAQSRMQPDCIRKMILYILMWPNLNLAIQWQPKEVCTLMDSATVQSWLRSVLTGSHKICMHGLAEMLMKRQLLIVSELVKVYMIFG